MKILVLGTGCAKCRQLFDNARKAVEEAGVEAEVIKVEDIVEITRYHVFMTPALVVNGTVKSAGKVVDAEQIRKWIAAAR